MKSIPEIITSQRTLFLSQKTKEVSYEEFVKEVLDGGELLYRDGSSVCESAGRSKFLRAVRKMNDLYTRQIQSLHHDVFDPKLKIPPPFMALRMWLSCL